MVQVLILRNSNNNLYNIFQYYECAIRRIFLSCFLTQSCWINWLINVHNGCYTLLLQVNSMLICKKEQQCYGILCRLTSPKCVILKMHSFICLLMWRIKTVTGCLQLFQNGFLLQSFHLSETEFLYSFFYLFIFFYFEILSFQDIFCEKIQKCTF